MQTIIRKIYYTIFPFSNYEKELENAIGDSKTLIDVGCGSQSPIYSFSRKFYSIGVDCFSPSIEKSKKAKIHNKYYKLNIMDIDKKFKANSFDCALASDVIEHFDKKEGLRLLKKMEKISRKKIIIFTPNGFLKQGEYDNNPWQVHKSGWTAEEMKKRGYKVVGINGLKSLRKEFTEIKYHPKIIWRIISDITQIFTRNNPRKAFQILCIKTK
ncbi:MAG TPA: methyltransferase domain-containing protein [archaeon]|nr:methyltransferase domain-containing protein [archaeon]